MSDLSGLLNTREKQQKKLFEEAYETRYGREPSCDPDLVCHLGDNVNFTLSWSAASGSLPTLRRSSGKLWIPSLSRWMVPKERLASLAFPVTEGCACVLGVPPLPVLDGHRAEAVCGNAMNFGSCAVVLLCGLVCFGAVTNTDSPSDGRR